LSVPVPGAAVRLSAGRAAFRERASWALYDFANTIFSMNIVTLYFAVWLVTERGATNTAYSVATSLSSVAVLFAAPWVGAVSDATGRRTPWVIGLTIACVAATFALAPAARVPGGAGILVLLALFAVANTAYQLALTPYNAMLPDLAPPEERGRLSGVGTAVGYGGSIAGVLLVAPFVSGGLGIRAGGRAASFVPTALLFLLFSLPLFFFCRDHRPIPRGERRRPKLSALFAELADAFRAARKHPGLLRFVASSYFYQDALGTAISFMALYAVAVLGLPAGGEIRLFVVLTIPAMIGAWIVGRACDRFGPRRTLAAVLVGWIVGLVVIASAPSLSGFWVGGVIVGLAFGGIWAAERPLMLRLSPPEESGRYFGLLALSARAAAIVGPLLWAAIVDGIGPSIGRNASYRLAVLSLSVMMAVALVLLLGVPRWVDDAPENALNGEVDALRRIP